MTETHDTSAAKLMMLLEAMSDADSDSREGLTVADLSRVLHRDKSVISRQLKPLVELGVVERTEDGRHVIGWRLFAIATRAGDQRLLLLAPPIMRRMTQVLRERVHFSIRRGGDVFTILSESPQRTIEAVGWVGRTSPLTCTSSGRVLLFDHSDDQIRELFPRDFVTGVGVNAPRDVEDLISRVRDARRAGFACADKEFDDDVTAMAAPVRDLHGRIVGALNVSAPSFRMETNRPNVSRSLVAAAAHLTSLLAHPQPSPSKPPPTITA